MTTPLRNPAGAELAARIRTDDQAALDARTPAQVEVAVAARTARGAKATPDQLRGLARHPDKRVRLAVAKNKRTTLGLLAILGQDADPSVRAAAARHKNCPADTLAALVRDKHMRVLTAVSENPNTDAATLHALVVERPEARTAHLAVAYHDNVSHETLLLLADHDDKSVRYTVTDHAIARECFTAELCRVLARREDGHVHLVQQPGLPADVLDILATSPDPVVRRRAARRNDLTDDQRTLIALAGGSEWNDR